VAATHYSVMVKETSQLFVAGPPVVERTGQKIGKNELGGSQIHTRNGVVDDEAASEADAFERVRRFLSYLPSSVYELPPRADDQRDNPADQHKLRSAIPENPSRRWSTSVRSSRSAATGAKPAPPAWRASTAGR
jgi:acetyl-CoA carboxylase carboxyltransferase component